MYNPDIIKLIKEAQSKPIPLAPDDPILKAYLQPGAANAGLQSYDLNEVALRLIPILTPLRNKIPRVTGGHNIQAEWRAITGINTAGLFAGLSEGNRGGVIATTFAAYTAAFRGWGLDDYVSFEADMAAAGFDDLKARATLGLLQSLMIQEENLILGGRGTVALGTTPTPTLATATTGGLLAAATYNVYCVALSYDAYWAMAGQNNGNIGQQLNIATAAVPTTITRTNADGSTDTYNGGAAARSAVSSIATTGSTSLINASVAPVPGAVAYAWFWGVAGSELLGAVTPTSYLQITATAAGTQNASAIGAGSDRSINALAMDGMITQLAKSGSGSFVQALASSTPGVAPKLTSDTAKGVVELDAAILAFWNYYRLAPDIMYVNAQQLQDISTKVLSASGGPMFTISVDGSKPEVQGSARVSSYFCKPLGVTIQIEVHPTMPPGTIMFWSDTVPYKLSGVTDIIRLRLRRDYYQMEWPVTRRRYEYGAYCDGVLQNFFPPAYGLLQNIGPG